MFVATKRGDEGLADEAGNEMDEHIAQGLGTLQESQSIQDHSNNHLRLSLLRSVTFIRDHVMQSSSFSLYSLANLGKLCLDEYHASTETPLYIQLG